MDSRDFLIDTGDEEIGREEIVLSKENPIICQRIVTGPLNNTLFIAKFEDERYGTRDERSRNYQEIEPSKVDDFLEGYKLDENLEPLD